MRAFGRVLRRPVLRRVRPAMLLSVIGAGMNVVAVAWHAVPIGPARRVGGVDGGDPRFTN